MRIFCFNIQRYVFFVNFFLGTQVFAFQLVKSHLSFEAKTNVPGLTVSGEAPVSEVILKQNKNILENLQGIVKVAELKTGIELRDEHMYEKVFQNEKGLRPDIKLKGSFDSCEVKNSSMCKLNANIEIRGKENPITLELVIEKTGDREFKMSSKFPLSLKKYEIDIPAYMGVKVKDSVEIELSAFFKSELRL